MPVALHELGEELAAMFEFNRQVRETLPRDPKKRREFLRTFKYNFEEGIKIIADAEMMKKFEKEFAKVGTAKLAELEKKDIIKVRQNYAIELSKNHQHKKARMDSLRHLFASLNSAGGDLTPEQKQEVSRKLERLERLQSIETATIDKAVEQSLHELEIALQSLQKRQR